MDGNAVSSIYQDIPTEIGKTYKLTFAFSPRPNIVDNKLNVKWGKTSVAQLDKSGEGLFDTDWQVYNYEIPSLCSSTRLSFDNLNETSDGLGSFIDAITLEESPSNLIANGSFETGKVDNDRLFTDWTVTGNIERLSSAPAFESDFGLAFNYGGKEANGSFSQTFATIPSAKYDLKFYSYENGNNEDALSFAQVQVNGGKTLVDKIVEASSKTWEPSTYSFVADSSSTTLKFSDRSTGNLDGTDFNLDNVSVTLSANQPACSR